MTNQLLKFEGLIAAPFTGFGIDGSLDLNHIEKQAGHLVDQQVAGAFVCGTTGEGFSLSVQERMSVAEKWAQVSGPDLILTVHVGHPCIADAKCLAEHAQKIGANAIAVMPTSCFRPATLAALVEYLREIAAAAPSLPFYYYHIPVLSGVTFKVYDLLLAAASRAPTLRGCKFTNEDIMDFGRCLDLNDGAFDLAFGRDEMMLAGLAVGATGFVGSTYNVAGRLYNRLIAAFNAGDLQSARKAQSKSREMIAVFNEFGGLPAIKASMELVGFNCGPMRLPMTTLSAAQKDALGQRLDGLGFFHFVAK